MDSGTIHAAGDFGYRRDGKEPAQKKGPENRGLEVDPVLQPLFRARPSYFFFFGAAFFLGAAFLVALFID
ncbi:MAG: hypothetical protein ABSF25_10245 [Bryobacteraceae bacterium]|jgi:hypothetical protein